MADVITTKTGNLKKLGYKSGKWQDRGFELRPNELIYRKGSTIKGRIPLLGCVIEELPAESKIDDNATTIVTLHGTTIKFPYVIKVLADFRETKKRTYYLVADTVEERDDWIKQVQNNINIISDFKKPATSSKESSPTIGSPALASNGNSGPSSANYESDPNAALDRLQRQPGVHAAPMAADETTRLTSIISNKMMPGVSGFIVTEVTPGGPAALAGLVPYRHLIVAIDHSGIGVNVENEQMKFITKKRECFEGPAKQLIVNAYDLETYIEKEHILVNASNGEAASLGLVISFISRPSDYQTLYVEGYRKQGDNFVLDTEKKYVLYLSNPTKDLEDVYIKALPSDDREKPSGNTVYIPLYAYHGAADYVTTCYVREGEDGKWFEKFGDYFALAPRYAKEGEQAYPPITPITIPI